MLSRIDSKVITVLVIVAALFLIPIFLKSPYYLRIIINMFIFTVLAYGIRLVALTGQLTMGHAAFMGIGAYVSALLTTNLGWNFWYCLPLSGITAAIVAMLVGYTTLRIKGAYFAISTFAFGEALRLMYVNWSGFFGGASGIANIPMPNPIVSLHFDNLQSLYILGLCLTVLALLIMYRLEKSWFGLTFVSIGQADILAQCVGINIMRYKLMAFVIACFFAGITGSFFAHVQSFISADDFTFTTSCYLLIYVVVGGTYSFAGPLCGVIVLILIPVLLRYIPNYNPVAEPIILVVFLLVTMLFLPRGLTSLPDRASEAVKRFQKGKEVQ